MEVARRRRRHGEGDDRSGDGWAAVDDNEGVQEKLAEGCPGTGHGGARGSGLPLQQGSSHRSSLTVQRSSSSSQVDRGGGGGVVLEINCTGGGSSSGTGRRARTDGGGGGRPNMIFTPSLVPVGMESVRSSPMTLGSVGDGQEIASGVRWATVENKDSGHGGGVVRGQGVSDEGSPHARTA